MVDITTPFIGLCLFLLSIAEAQSYPAIPGYPLKFNDTFEANNTQWTIFEEIVNDCANVGVGLVVRNTTLAYRSRASLSVISNAKKVMGSNHVLAQRKLANVGVNGRFVYHTFSYINPSILPYTQTGPEFSLQSTLPIGLTKPKLEPIMRTMIGGIQYVGSTYIPNKWNIWARTTAVNANGELAAWVNTSSLPFPNILSEKGWWKLSLAMDFAQKKYLNVAFTSPNGTYTNVNLTSFAIAREVKFTDGGLSATLEAQNLYDCHAVHVHNALYDNVNIQQTSGVVPLPLIVPDKTSTVFAGASDRWILSSTLSVFVKQAPSKGTVSLVGTSNLTYTATAPGGDSVLITICHKTTFQCTNAWWTIVSNNRAPVGTNVQVETINQCGQVVTIDSPISDPDMNLNATSAQVISGTASVDLSSGNVKFKYNLTGKTGKGEDGFNVKVCDVKPWEWCASAWIVVAWDCS